KVKGGVVHQRVSACERIPHETPSLITRKTAHPTIPFCARSAIELFSLDAIGREGRRVSTQSPHTAQNEHRARNLIRGRKSSEGQRADIPWRHASSLVV